MRYEWKGWFRLGITLFLLYLAIHYWGALSHGALLVLGASAPLLLGAVIAYAVNILNPDLVIFGGSMSKLGDFILKPLKEEAVRLCMYESGKNTEFVLSELADDAGVVGAAALYIQEIIGY